MVSKKVLPIALVVSFGLFVQQASARDFLEELFGLGGNEPAARSDGGAGQSGASAPSAGQAAGAEQAKKRVASSGGAFCVRSCDGYFFPMPGVGKGNQQSMCEMACPSATVDVYRGGSIETSKNARGQSYAALANAFSFRSKVTEKCGCNAAETSQAHALKSLRQDPTLRNGDIVFDGAGASVYRGATFASAETSAMVSASARKTIKAVLALPRAAPVGEGAVAISRAVDNTPSGASVIAASKQGTDDTVKTTGHAAQKSASTVAIAGPADAAQGGGKF
jgi:hypothetical protein